MIAILRMQADGSIFKSAVITITSDLMKMLPLWTDHRPIPANNLLHSKEHVHNAVEIDIFGIFGQYSLTPIYPPPPENYSGAVASLSFYQP